MRSIMEAFFIHIYRRDFVNTKKKAIKITLKLAGSLK